jgi:phage terminase small subunit
MSEATAGPGSPLNAKQLRFVEEYLTDLNATQAAIRAGYSEKTAYSQGQRLLKHVEISRLIAESREATSERLQITQDYVLTSIMDAMERCKQSEAVLDRSGKPVMVETQDGTMTPAYTFNASGVFKGAELLGKHLGMFAGESGGGDNVADALREIAGKLPG